MTAPIMPEFLRFPNEAAIIGRLLAGYGELEFSLCFLVQFALSDQDKAFKALFRARGETQRIDIADALARQHYRSAGLGTPYEEGVGAMRYCLRIRNQYAHCHWADHHELGLRFIDLEELTARDEHNLVDLTKLTFYQLDVPTLARQEAFFRYTEDLLTHVNFEFRIRAGLVKANPHRSPQKIERPPLHKQVTADA